MPGSPPISTREPSTRPPPRILSTSPLLSDILFSTDESMSDNGMGLWPEPGTDTAAAAGPFFPVATVSSTIVFHSPHAGHLPIHFGLSFPHALQNHTVFVFTVAITSYIISTNVDKKKILLHLSGDNISQDGRGRHCQSD